MTTRFHHLHKEVQDELKRIARTLLEHGKGILLTDESIVTLCKRFKKIGVKNTEENRRIYRQMLFSVDSSIANYLSGVCMSQESLYHLMDDCTPFVYKLKIRGILVGIGADEGFVELSGSENEYATQGLENFAKRCADYKVAGCDFAKLRCRFVIDNILPSFQSITENSKTLARFASICQVHRIVPILECDVSTQGKHSIERAQKVSETVLAALFKALHDYNIYLEGIILKCNMITDGAKHCKKCSTAEIALATLETLRRTVPSAVPGIMFTSGGQTEETATVNLNAINMIPIVKPWTLTFFFGRALLTSALTTWKGQRQNVFQAQTEFLQRAKANGLACVGKYVPGSILTSADQEKIFYDSD